MAVSGIRENRQIERVTCPSKDEFTQSYLKKGKPVVIEGAIEDWPSKQWTLEYLYSKAKNNEVFVRSNTNCDEYRSGRKYDVRKTTFGKYIDDLMEDNKRSHNSYLAVQNIKRAFPQLKDEMTVPEYVGKLHGGPYMWIAPQGHYEYCHEDPDDGLLVILNGSKQVRLFGCDPAPLYPNPLGSKGRTIQSQVDCNNPDFNEHPKFADVVCHYTTVKSGEMLYIPAFWWHQVTTLETTVSINMFWGDAGVYDYLEKVMHDPFWPAFRYWLLNVIEQNRACDSFERILSRMGEVLENFFHTQWHEHGTPEHTEILVKAVMDHLGITELPAVKSTAKHPPDMKIRGLLWRN